MKYIWSPYLVTRRQGHILQDKRLHTLPKHYWALQGRPQIRKTDIYCAQLKKSKSLSVIIHLNRWGLALILNLRSYFSFFCSCCHQLIKLPWLYQNYLHLQTTTMCYNTVLYSLRWMESKGTYWLDRIRVKENPSNSTMVILQSSTISGDMRNPNKQAQGFHNRLNSCYPLSL